MRKVLKAKRKELGLTRQQTADELDITIRAYQYIESGERNPSWKLIQRFEKLFKMPITQLLEIYEEPNTPGTAGQNPSNLDTRECYVNC